MEFARGMQAPKVVDVSVVSVDVGVGPVERSPDGVATELPVDVGAGPGELSAAARGRTADAQPIKDDIDGLVAVGSAALGDAVDEVGEIADALARTLINFKGSDGAREASMHMSTASEALTDLVRIAQAIADTLTSQGGVTETAIATTSRFRPPGASISQAITNAASAAFVSSLRALLVVLRDVLLSPEVSEHTAKAVRDGAKAASAFGRAALQRLDGGAAERVRAAEQERKRRAGPEGDVIDPHWVQKRPGAFGNEEIVDSSRKRQRREQRLREEERARGSQEGRPHEKKATGGGSAWADGGVIDIDPC